MPTSPPDARPGPRDDLPGDLPGDMPFDRKLRRLRRDRAARRAGNAHVILDHVAEEMMARLDLVTRRFEQVLVLGAASSMLTRALRSRGMAVSIADPGFVFADSAGGVQCDEDRLAFGAGAFDLIVSLGVLDGVNDLPGALVLVRRALRPDGLFLAAFAGAGSLPRLKAAMLAADAAEGGAAARVHPQIDVRAAGALLQRAGFALPVVDAERLELRYRDLRHLIGDLRALAGTNILHARSRRPIGRAGLAAAIADFASHAGPDGKTAEHLEIVHLSGWAPAPSQPQPARRGSGKVSMTEALRPPSP